MSFFGSLGKTLNKVVHNKAFQVAFPVVAAGNILASKAPRMFKGGVEQVMHRLDSIGSHSVQQAQSPVIDYHLNQLPPPQGPFYSGGYTSWDYSMPSQVYSTRSEGPSWGQLGW